MIGHDLVYGLATVLAALRLTELVAIDTIFEPVRQWFHRMGFHVLSCVRCISVWAAITATTLYLTFPMVNVVIAIAWVYLFKAELIDALRTPHYPSSVVVLRIRSDRKIEVAYTDLEAHKVLAVVQIASDVLAARSGTHGGVDAT